MVDSATVEIILYSMDIDNVKKMGIFLRRCGSFRPVKGLLILATGGALAIGGYCDSSSPDVPMSLTGNIPVLKYSGIGYL